MSILGFLLSFLSVFVFSFVLWRKLKEDYPNDKIFLLTAGLVFTMVVGNWVTWSLPIFSFWISLFLAVLAGVYLVKKLDLRLFEVIDSVTPAWFWFLMLGNFTGFLSTRALGALVESAMAGVATLSFMFFNARYRNFPWYPSGKVGFAGLASLGVYCLLRAILGTYITLTSSLSVGIFNGIMGLVLFLGCGIVIRFRARE